MLNDLRGMWEDTWVKFHRAFNIIFHIIILKDIMSCMVTIISHVSKNHYTVYSGFGGFEFLIILARLLAPSQLVEIT